MKNSKDHIWYTGDWKSKMNDQAPYNGLQIKATAKYSEPTVPPSTQNLMSVELDIIDFTKDKEGVSSKVKIKKVGSWHDILIPEKKKGTDKETDKKTDKKTDKEAVKETDEETDEVTEKQIGKQPNLDFTVVGINNNTLGQVKLDHNSNGIYLNIQFRYGLTGRKREEIGYVMKFDSIYNDKHDPIEVEE